MIIAVLQSMGLLLFLLADWDRDRSKYKSIASSRGLILFTENEPAN